VIKASSGLSEEEIAQMVRDAEAHSEEDARFEEMVLLRNQADGLVHASRKALADAGDKVTEAEKAVVETAAEALETAVRNGDKAEIEAKMQALSEESAKIAQKLYAEPADAAAGAEAQADGGDTVDAEFEEVDEDKKK
jgi:molecular chaperone DnaK